METNRNGKEPDPNCCYLQKFRLYETHSNFYMIGRDKHRTFWRVLKIDRLMPSELNILEDSTRYSDSECCDLLRRVHEGNKSTGGLKLVTICYGIIGFIKFLGPYYMILITKRRKIGEICGHVIYAITKSKMIPIPNPSLWSSMTNSKNENRYKKLLCTVDLTRDFFFSYSYHVLHCLQKNLCDNKKGQAHYETMFVWNEFLTRGIRNNLQNTLWTVALVYGFFKQVKLSVSCKDFKLILIARRSRHYAGTRYLKRGVNEKGRVANDVETEQIVFEDVPDGCPVQISSVVQHRGSIPLFWSQETSRLNIKPNIIWAKKDKNYEATKLHFENLRKRYGNPIIILNLIKSHENKPRESILRAEFANAIRSINKSLSEEDRLRFLHWDLHRHSRKATNVLSLLGKVAAYALNLTGIFYCQVTPSTRPMGLFYSSYSKKNNDGFTIENPSNESDFGKNLDPQTSNVESEENGNQIIAPMFQKGVLRTNCIDCLDRTNVAQYAYGLVALGRQLHVLGFIESPIIDLDNPLAEDLMRIYETMGDTLALQYGGSAAHNKNHNIALFIFGDSLFDAGNANYLKNYIGGANMWPYGETYFKHPTGRFCDGRIIPDFIAEYLKLPFILPYLQPGNSQSRNGVNFATGAAGALAETSAGKTIDFTTQLSNFKHVEKGLRKKLGYTKTKALLSRAIYFFTIGRNDYIQAFVANSTLLYNYSREEFVGMVVGNITAVIKEIYENGGRKFGILSLEPLVLAPKVRSQKPNYTGEVTHLVKENNKELAEKLKELQRQLKGFKYSYFNFYASSIDRINNPSEYEFKEVKMACCGAGPYRGIENSCGKTGPGGKKEFELCKNPSEYLYFDPAHGTEKFNGQIAELIWSGNHKFTTPYNLSMLVEA